VENLQIINELQHYTLQPFTRYPDLVSIDCCIRRTVFASTTQGIRCENKLLTVTATKVQAFFSHFGL